MGRDGGRKGGRGKGAREPGRDGREGEGRREGGREGAREGGREGGKRGTDSQTLMACLPPVPHAALTLHHSSALLQSLHQLPAHFQQVFEGCLPPPQLHASHGGCQLPLPAHLLHLPAVLEALHQLSLDRMEAVLRHLLHDQRGRGEERRRGKGREREGEGRGKGGGREEEGKGRRGREEEGRRGR